MMKGFLAAIILWSTLGVKGQADSAQQLTLPQFMETVRRYHPVARQANLIVEQARAELLAARGNFDPTLTASFERKRFAGEQYYQYWNPEVRVPTWYGIEVYTGLEEIYGSRVTTESTIGQTSYLGVSVPVLRNLVIDRRRAVLAQAKIYRDQSYAEQRSVLNDLMQDAIYAYWEWAATYRTLDVLNKVVRVNEDRLSLVKIGYRQGDRPAIDTTEALAQLQNFQYMQSQANMEYVNAAISLSNFLWLPNDSAYTLPPNVLPDTTWYNIPATTNVNLEETIASALPSHPVLQTYNYKLQWLEVDKRYKFQGLLPYVNVKANLLNKGYDVTKGISTSFFNNNQSIGLNIVMPLRISEGRANYQRAKIKLKDTGYEYALKTREVENKIRSSYNKLEAYGQQVRIYEAAFKNYETLFRGEDTRFRIGESSLFLLNSRENKVLETQQKLIDLKATYLKSLASLDWAAGRLF